MSAAAPPSQSDLINLLLGISGTSFVKISPRAWQSSYIPAGGCIGVTFISSGGVAVEIVGWGGGSGSSAQVFAIIKRRLQLAQTSGSQFILLLSTPLPSCAEPDQIRLWSPSRA